MKPLLCAKAARTNDHYTMHSLGVGEHELILRVAHCALDALQEGEYDTSAPCIVCGHGNNGADGMALATLLWQIGCRVTIVYTGKTDADGKPDADAMSAQCKIFYQKALTSGIPVLVNALPERATVFVDAIFGIGLRGEIDAHVCRVIEAINERGVPVLAIDIPSGVYADTGNTAQIAVCATQTLSVQSDKIGLSVYPGAGHAGTVTLADVGIVQDPDAPPIACFSIEDSDLPFLMPPRPARSHKGTYGRVLVIGGSPCMAGAAYFAAMGAFRAGAGLVEIFTPEQNRTVLQTLIPEAILCCYQAEEDLVPLLKGAIGRADAVVMGCGIGCSDAAKAAVSTALDTISVPLVLDADALNVIAKHPELLKNIPPEQKKQTVMTPHAAEAARLLGAFAGIDAVTEHILATAQSLYEQFEINVLLKDAHSVIHTCDGICFVNSIGSTALSTAGSGDVLAGVIAGLAASKTNPMPMGKTAALGAYLHAKAGVRAEQAVGAHAAMARDILNGLCKE